MPERPEAASAAPGVASRSDADVANSGAAVRANRSFVTPGPDVRIAFCEQGRPGEPMAFRSAVQMSRQDAISLKNLLIEKLDDDYATRSRQRYRFP